MGNQLLYDGVVDYLEVPGVSRYASSKQIMRTLDIPDGEFCNLEGKLCCFAAVYRTARKDRKVIDCSKFVEEEMGSIVEARLHTDGKMIEKCKGCKER